MRTSEQRDCHRWTGDVYFSTGLASQVYEATSGGGLVTVAGNGTIGCTGAEIGDPHGVAVDSHGNVYIADSWCNVIWEVTSSGRVAVAGIPGNANTGFSGDGGPATAQRSPGPWAWLWMGTAVSISRTGEAHEFAKSPTALSIPSPATATAATPVTTDPPPMPHWMGHTASLLVSTARYMSVKTATSPMAVTASAY